MIQIDQLRIEEKEASDFVHREDYTSENDYQHALAFAKDDKMIIGKCVATEKGLRIQKQFQFRLSKWVLNSHPEESRKHAMQSLFASLGESILENNGGVI